MNYYKAIISYDGTDYHGWQSQKHGNTVQDVLTKTFKNTFFQPVLIAGASRTDAGVHAVGQVASLQTPLNIASDRLKQILNENLPASIIIKNLEKCPHVFNPRANVLEKIYQYDFSLEKTSPFEARYCLFFNKKIDLEKFYRLPEIFIGQHDFRSFCTGHDYDSTIKTIDDIKIYRLDDRFRIIFKGQSFLRYMIRRIVGGMLVVSASKNMDQIDLKKALEQKDPQQSLLTAPPQGLTLMNIKYRE
jgi:tRNA pseudouridine38-40 synthase